MNRPDAQHDELRRLLAQLSDGTLDEAGFAQLDAMLDSDDAAQALYIEHVTHEALLMREYGEAKPAPAPIHSIREVTIDRSVAGRVGPVALGAIAAAVLAVAAAFAVYLLVINATPDAPRPEPVYPMVATMLAGDDVSWVSEPIASGSAVTGAPIEIRSGRVEMETMKGIAMALSGRVSARVDAPDRVTLTRGMLRARVPAGVDGFTVMLPNNVRVVDLGTEFAIRVSESGEDEIFVLEGSVAVHVPGQPVRLVVANQAVRVDSTGSHDRGFVDATIAGLELPYPDAEFDEPGPLQTGLVFHERFDGRFDTESVTSKSTPRFDAGRVGMAAQFDGSRHEAVIEPIAALDGAEAMTIALWARRTRANDSAALFIHRFKDGSVLHGFTTTPNGPGRAQFRIADRKLDTPDHALPLDGSWVHLAGVWVAGESMRVYVNGKPVSELLAADTEEEPPPSAPLNAAGTWRFGNDDCCGGNRHLLGSIDDAALWNRALTDHEIKSLYLQSTMGRDASLADIAPEDNEQTNTKKGGDDPRQESDEEAPV